MKFNIIILILIASTVIYGQELLSKVQTHFNSMESFSCSFNQEVQSGNKSQNIISDGKFFYSKTDNFRIEFKDKIIVSDGTGYWNYDKKANRVVISKMEDNPLNFSLSKLIFEYPNKCDITEGPGKIKLVPTDDELGFDQINIFFNEDYMVHKVELVDFNNTVYRFSLSNINKDYKVKREMFVFIPPKGAKVIDLR